MNTLVYSSNKNTMISKRFLLLLLAIPQISMETSLVRGFQIVSPHLPSIHSVLLPKTPQAQHKQLYRQMAPSPELMEPTATPTTQVAVRGDDAATESPIHVSSSSSSIDACTIQSLRQEIVELGKRTERGFKASRADRERAEKLIFDLAQYNRIREPVSTYYGNQQNVEMDHNKKDAATIKGKWTLIYTDAPDITGLGVPSPFVTLGRIGQDCSHPPYIANVIEWCAPSWAGNIPFLVGNNKNSNASAARILQKVVTFGSAVPASPTVVDLNVAGLQLSAGNATMSTSIETSESKNNSNDLRTAIEEDGLIVGVLKQQQKDKPNIDLLKLDESRQPPFGSFEILYLDDTLRITKTSRNHYAINVRIQSREDEWF